MTTFQQLELDAMTRRTEVFYLNPADGWAIARFDAEGNQLGEAACYFHRADAIDAARRFHAAWPCRVFKRDGTQLREIPAAPKKPR